MAKQLKTLKSAKSAKSDKSLSLLVPESAPLATMPETPKAIEPAAAAAAHVKATKEVPDGYTNFIARDEVTGTVFATCQASKRNYLSAVIADSPLGLCVARWTSDHKAALRYAKAINAQAKGGTPGMSGARVAEVKAVVEAPQGAISLGRNREEEYYQAAGFEHGPNWAAREAARAARIAAFAAAQAASNVQGPVQQLE